MPYALVVELNGRSVFLSVHPTLKAASLARSRSAFKDAKIVTRKG
jgi:hypothetical protein